MDTIQRRWPNGPAMIDAILDALDRMRERRRLAALGDQELKDIGLSRADAEHEATKPAWHR